MYKKWNKESKEDRETLDLLYDAELINEDIELTLRGKVALWTGKDLIKLAMKRLTAVGVKTLKNCKSGANNVASSIIT